MSKQARVRKSPKSESNSIQVLSTAVFDTGRRGEPKMGCDCVQCFGYCMVDPEVALRERAATPRLLAEDGSGQ